MNKPKLFILCIVLFSSVLLSSRLLWADMPPYQQTEFKIPESYQENIKGYPSSWRRLSGYEYSALHWDQFVVVYTNNGGDIYANNHFEFMRIYEEDLDYEEGEASYKDYAVGTILLKESFLSQNSRPGLSLLLSGMIKREKGYDSAFGDWEYFQSKKNGEIIVSGNSKDAEIQTMCIGCHSNIQDKDFVFATHYSLSPR